MPGEPGEPDRVKAVALGGAAGVAGVVPLVEHRDVQDAEVQPVVGTRDDGGAALGVEVEAGP
ncbi:MULTISPECIES: hypothetical protein [unclassified Arthrobacter]|uniref:hypothetical protein n=1 Tax=unclassified Arthrobacter TaxID=235627 RepID=UPI0027D81CF4|nr:MULTISPECIES: hypothetical protein [unclassified Arthrobacter]